MHTTNETTLIEVRHLTKQYGDTVAQVMMGWTTAAMVAGAWSLLRRDTT